MGFLIRSGEDGQTKAFGCRIPSDLQVDLKKLRERAKRLGFRPDTGVVVTRCLRTMVAKSNSELDAYEKEMADHVDDDDSADVVDQHSHVAIPDHDADTP